MNTLLQLMKEEFRLHAKPTDGQTDGKIVDIVVMLLSKLYQDTAEVVWNGNQLKGKDAIIKFYEDLPTTDHKVESLDSQPLSGEISAGQLSILVKTFGTVKFPNNTLKSFHQSFILTSLENKWKIVGDNFRFQDKSDV